MEGQMNGSEAKVASMRSRSVNAVTVGLPSLFARMKLRAASRVGWFRTEVYRKLARAGSRAASRVASWRMRSQISSSATMSFM